MFMVSAACSCYCSCSAACSCSLFLLLVHSFVVFMTTDNFLKYKKDFHIRDHSLPVLGEYKSTASLKHSKPLHILIGQSTITNSGSCSPWLESL